MGTNEPTGRDLVPGFAALISAAREARGLSRIQLADLAELSFNTVYSIESEKRAPSLRVASKLAAALELRVWLHDPATLVEQRPPAGPDTAGPGGKGKRRASGKK